VETRAEKAPKIRAAQGEEGVTGRRGFGFTLIRSGTREPSPITSATRADTRHRHVNRKWRTGNPTGKRGRNLSARQSRLTPAVDLRAVVSRRKWSLDWLGRYRARHCAPANTSSRSMVAGCGQRMKQGRGHASRLGCRSLRGSPPRPRGDQRAAILGTFRCERELMPVRIELAVGTHRTNGFARVRSLTHHTQVAASRVGCRRGGARREWDACGRAKSAGVGSAFHAPCVGWRHGEDR
jgi:hypothetical protein